MNENKEKVTISLKSAVTEREQSLFQKPNISISENEIEINTNFKQVNSPDYLYTISLTELFDTVYQPKMQVVDGLLYSGVYLFVGAPKVGKSFFMAQISYHVSAGIPLWGYDVNKGTVLYLALEDHYARIQKRLSRMFGTETSTGTDRVRFATKAKILNEGLEAQLKRFVSENPNTRLIIIDTLQKIREVGGEKFSYANDYEIVTKFKEFADQNNICIILVHHTRKQVSDDSFEAISGTNGLLGAADGAFIMQREKRTDNKALLDVVGRDQQDQRLHLMFDREYCLWRLTETETELWEDPPDPILEAVSTYITEDNPQWVGSASELISVLGIADIQPNVFTRRLNIAADKLWNKYNIQYESRRSNSGRVVKLTLHIEVSDDSDGCDDILQ